MERSENQEGNNVLVEAATVTIAFFQNCARFLTGTDYNRRLTHYEGVSGTFIAADGDVMPVSIGTNKK